MNLATPNRASSNAGVLLGNGDGTFQGAVAYATGSGPSAIATADADGDGQLDLVVANGTGNTLTILRGNGDGTFAAGATIPTGGSPAGVVAGDFNGDGVVDFGGDQRGERHGEHLPRRGGAAHGGTARRFHWRPEDRTCYGGMRAAATCGCGPWMAGTDGRSSVRTVADTTWEFARWADFEGDGKADLLWRNKVNGQTQLLADGRHDAAGRVYVATVDRPTTSSGRATSTATGKSDILWRHTALGDVWVWLMDGATPPGADLRRPCGPRPTS